MLIQKILYPDNEICDEAEMFFRGISRDSIKENTLQLKANETASLNTYFNSFSIGKWKEYTTLSNLSFHFTADCNCIVHAYHVTATFDNEKANLLKKIKSTNIEEKIENNRKCISTKTNEIPSTLEILKTNNQFHHIVNIPELYNEGLIHISITTQENTEISEAGWYTNISDEQINNIKIAIGICTYKREEFLKANVSKILNQIIKNENSCLNGKIEVYVADNGQTIPVDYFNSQYVHVYPNINLGGAAGFTRTMIESIINDRHKSFSHIILSDDDIILSTDILERTYQFLCFLKPEYSKSMLGGAMLLENRRYLQYENGAFFDGTTQYICNKSLFDLRQEDCVTANLLSSKINYQAWWYCCIPSIIVSENNLPFPFFIHCDDIEYGIRNSNHELILLNGICVWHPSFINKNAVWTFYYDIRNCLITSAIHNYNKRKILTCIFKSFVSKSLFHQYAHAYLINKAVTDFLKGPNNFIHQDAAALQNQLVQYKYKVILPEELHIDIKKTNFYLNLYTPIPTAIRQLFSYFLPSKKIIVCNINTISNLYIGRRIYAYDATTNTGFLFERDIKCFFKLCFSFLIKFIQLCFKFRKLRKEFFEKQKIITGIDFWSDYLKLSDGAVD